jgi:hypothetical protein
MIAVQGCLCFIRWPPTLPGWSLQQDQPPADRPRLPALEEINERWPPFCSSCIGEKLLNLELLCARDQRENFEIYWIWAEFSSELSIGLCSAGVFCILIWVYHR